MCWLWQQAFGYIGFGKERGVSSEKRRYAYFFAWRNGLSGMGGSYACKREDVLPMVKKLAAVILLYGVMTVVGIPLLITLLFGGFQEEVRIEAKALYGLSDYFAAEREWSELEEYVAGVVSAEMPAAFDEEALKAQAVAARTYQVRKMQESGSHDVIYDVGQAYCTQEEQKEKWGEHYETWRKKIRDAVAETAGEIMVYEEEPILAVFHAQSCGKTEDSENVWMQELPYLRSVDSSGDRQAPDFETTLELSQEEVWQKLSKYGNLGASASELSFSRKQCSEAGYVLTIKAGDLILEGNQVRQALGLRSTNFTVKREGETFFFTTKGYGHGAGMSQYGAEALAEEGKDYHEILNHYYTGISFEKIA